MVDGPLHVVSVRAAGGEAARKIDRAAVLEGLEETRGFLAGARFHRDETDGRGPCGEFAPAAAGGLREGLEVLRFAPAGSRRPSGPSSRPRCPSDEENPARVSPEAPGGGRFAGAGRGRTPSGPPVGRMDVEERAIEEPAALFGMVSKQKKVVRREGDHARAANELRGAADGPLHRGERACLRPSGGFGERLRARLASQGPRALRRRGSTSGSIARCGGCGKERRLPRR